MKIVSWNMAHKPDSWHYLLDMDIDLALLQEASKPPSGIADRVEVDPAPWEAKFVGGSHKFRTAIAKLSDRIEVDWIEAKPLELAGSGELVASWPGTLTAASVRPPSGKAVVVVSLYAQWVTTHALAKPHSIFADASVHHLVSDLSVFIAKKRGHRILAAGDLNVLRGYGEHGSDYWAARYMTVFDRMEALGLTCVGPEYPNGKRADPWPDELPRDSRNVPTFFRPGKSPATATRQLDYVFASTELIDSLTVRALNNTDQWGPSDHCRIRIDLATGT